MWLFVIDRPFYPSVEEYDTKEAADQRLAEFLDGTDVDGEYSEYDSRVYVAEVTTRKKVKTDY